MSREKLLQMLKAERAHVLRAVEGATVAELRAAPAGRWSTEDVLRHLMDFEQDIIDGVHALREGRDPEWFGIRNWNARNAERAAQWPARPWGEIRLDFDVHRAQLEAALLSRTDEELANPKVSRGFHGAAIHDYEHLPGILERLAWARGNVREATVRYVEIARREVLALLQRVPLEAFDERIPGRWSIREILIHLAVRDRMWTEIVLRVSAGGSDEWPHTRGEMDTWNQAEVAKLAHLSGQVVLYELGEARAQWNAAMLTAPDGLVHDSRYQEWAERRFRHDRMHLPQLVERVVAWRKLQQG